uniref:neuroblast differentiation-associated protein AHNAK-like n=1 Tax=Scatophagus argus TaxID=75038 RepID=UPI001ED7E207|nr:neuroblast differentiation-associated protein AHNAK-like [Scatophagus argus]
MFEKRSTPKMSKLKEVHSPESGVIVKTAKDGCAEGLVYGGGGKEGIFIKEVVPESPASKNLQLKEGDQILSATVYFDNMSYEDAIQILEHAQAYKVKLCLKRKPDITESEPAIESDVIPEEELHAPEMREAGKTKRHGDARISWPKFPSFGKGRKSRFTRSHSSSEADEQRKLELSPTTSDTESPIKSQDALKGKKRHKIKLSNFARRGRISSSEDQDTDTTTGQISGKMLQTHEAPHMLSPERSERPSGETPEVYVTVGPKVVENFEQIDQKLTGPQTVQHKAELITLDSTLKTADLTVALADKESSSGVKSPDGKKKKKERSELKMKILGKDKSHKKDTKAKSSPKRLKTLGASIEIPDQPENEKSDVIPSSQSHTKLQEDQLTKSGTTQKEISVPKVELDISDIAFIRKSPQKDEEKRKKCKDIKQKQESRTGPAFKLPKIGLSDIPTEETIQKMNVNVEERTTRIKQLTTEGTEMKEDPYEQLSSRTCLPKREEIEIPGMEDMSKRITAKGLKEPKAGFMGHYEELQAETVQLSIDVDSVKEAVSKLPGYKLPKVDTSGVPIPEEITVIDANAQRISVKTPTKVVDTKAKHETHFTKFDITASPEISKTTIKLPKITPADLTSEELLIETKVGFTKPEKKYQTKAKQSEKEMKREDITIPGKESTQAVAAQQAQDSGTDGIKYEYKSATTLSPKESDKKSRKVTTAGFGITKPDIKIPDIGIHLPKQNLAKKKGDSIKEEGAICIGQYEGVVSDVKMSEIDGIEYIDSVGGPPAKKDSDTQFTGFGVNLDATKAHADIFGLEIRSEVQDVNAEAHTINLPKSGTNTADISVNLPDAHKAINIDGGEIKTLERHGKSSKFKIPNLDISMPKVKGSKIDSSLSKKDVDVTLPEAKAEFKFPEVPEVDVTLGNVGVSIPEPMMEVEKPELGIKPLSTEGELDERGGRFKLPKLGITMPKVKGPEIDFSLSKKDAHVTLPEVKADVKLSDAELKEASAKVEIKAPEFEGVEKDAETLNINTEGSSLDVKTTATELEGKGSKFKMPKFGISLPKVKGPEIDLSSSKKDVGVTLPETKAEVKLTDVEHAEPRIKVEVKAPEIAVHQKDAEGSPSKFKMPTFKLPKFGVGTPNVPKVPDMDKDVKIDGSDIHIPEVGPAVNIEVPNIDLESPSIDVKTRGAEQDGRGNKFKMPHLGFSMPKVKGPKVDLSLSKKDVDVTLPEAKADVTLPKVDTSITETSMEIPDAKAQVELPEVPDIDVEMKPPECEEEMDGHGGKFKIPKFGIKMPKLKGPEFDLNLSKKDVDVQRLPETKEVNHEKGDVSIPEVKMEVKNPELEMQSLQFEGELDGQGERFKMPKFGIKMAKVKGPEFDLRLSKKDVDVTLPQTKVDVNLPDASKMDVSLGKVEVLIPEAKAEVEKPDLEIKPLQTEAERQKSKFKMAKFGMAMPKVKGPEFHLGFSKKDVGVTLSEAKADVNLPDVELNEPSVKEALIPEVEVKETAVEIKPLHTDTELEGQEGKVKMPKIGITMPKVRGHETDLILSLPEAKAEVKLPETPALAMDIKLPECEVETDGQGSKFKLPKFGISLPKAQGAETDVSLQKKDVSVKLPEAKAEVRLPEVPEIDVSIKKVDVSLPEATMELNKVGLEKSLQSEGELDGQGSKFKMPKFGMPVPKVKGPEIDFSLSKRDVNITLPQAQVDVSLPDVKLEEPSAKMEIKAAEIGTPSHSQKESPSKFKMPAIKFPKFGVATPNVSATVPEIDKDIKVDGTHMHISVPHANVDVPEVKTEVHLQEVEIKECSGGIVIDQHSGVEVDAKMKKPRFSLPKFSFSKPSIKAPDIDVSLPDVNTAIPEGTLEIKGGNMDMKPVECEAEVDGQGSKFKMPGPEIDLSLSKKDVDVTLPEAKAEVKLPDVELKEPSAEIEIKAPEIKVATKKTEESPSKFKMPTFKLPKFGVGAPSASVEMPDLDKDARVDGGDIKIPEEVLTVDVAAPSIDIEVPSIHMTTTETEHGGKGSKFKMPSLGFSAPQLKRPEIDLSLSKKDVDVTLPEAKAEVKLPDVELEEPSAEIEIKAPEIKVATKKKEGSPSKFKMPTFKLPKFGVGAPSASVEMPDLDKDVRVDGGDIKIPKEVLTVDVAAPSIDIEVPSIHMTTTETEHEGKGSKFKMPSLGFSAPQLKRPEIDLSLSKKDVDVTLPEAKAEVKLPDVELKEPSAEIEIKAPEIKVATKKTEGSPSKFKMPTFKLPKFGVGAPSASVEMPDLDKDVRVDGGDIKIPEEVLTVDVAAPSIDIEVPSIHMTTTETEHEGKGSKFKMPSLGFSAPQLKRPEIDLSLSKKDVDVTLPEAKAEVKLPDVELKEPSAEIEIKAPEIKVATKKKEGSPSKFKMPTFKLPKFGVGAPSASVEMPDLDKDVRVDGGDIKIPEEVLTVDVAAPSIDIEVPSIHMTTTETEHEGKGSKFKMPSLGFSAPQLKRPEIDLSLSKKDVDVTLPEAKAEVKLPDVELKEPSAEIEIKAPEIKVATKKTEGSPSKFKMPTFKLPKFGVGAPSASVEMPDLDKDVKIDGANIKIPDETLTVDVAAPSIDTEVPSIQMTNAEIEHKGKASKFKMPSLGFSAPQLKRPEIDLNLSNKDADVSLPEAKVEVKLPDVELKEPSAEIEIKAPEIKVATKKKEGSPSKFKMPTFKLPKFGVGAPSASVEMPDLDKDVRVDGGDIKIPEEVLTVDVAAPSIDIEVPSIHMTTTETEHEGKGSKFKMPSFGFSAPQLKRPETDLSLSKKDVDVTLPEAKAEIKLPDVELEEPSAEIEIKAPEIKVATKKTEGSPSKFKMPTFKLPKFGVGAPSASVEMPDLDKDVKIGEGDIKIPKDALTVDVAAPSIDIEVPSIHMTTTEPEHEGKGSKFKMPSLGFSAPQVKRPEIDLSLSKKDVDVTLPEAKAEVKLPDVELKEPSAEIEIKAPEIKVATKKTEGSPSKFKMPTFKLPKFGVGAPSASVEMPDLDKDVKIGEGDIKIPKDALTVDVAAPSIDIEVPSIHMTTTETEHEGKGSKFKMPSFGFSAPQVKRPEIDLSLSKKDVDVTLPEAKATVQLPEVELEKSSAKVEIKAPGTEVHTSDVEGSPSKFKMSTFKLPKFGAAAPQVSVAVPDEDKDIKVHGEHLKLPQAKAEIKIPDVEIKEPGGSISVSQAPLTEGDAKLKTTRFTLPKFSFSKQSTKEHVADVSLPDADVSLPEDNVQVKQPEVELKPAEGDTKLDVQGSKFKMPKFGISIPKVKGPEIDLSLSKKDVDVTLPEAKAEVQLPDVKIKKTSADVEIKAPEIAAQTGTVEGSPSKFKMPTFTLPKFGVATPKASVDVPHVAKDIKTEGGELEVSKRGATVDVTAPSIDTKGQSVDVKIKGSELEGSESKFNMPNLGISVPKIKGPETDLSLSKKNVDITTPDAKVEVKLPSTEGDFSVSDTPTVETEAKLKRPNWTFPKFSFSRTSSKAPDVDVNLDTSKADVASPEAKGEVSLTDAEVQGPSGAISMEEPSAAEPDANLKKSKFSLPTFSFSKSSVKELEVSAEIPHAEVSLPEVEVKVKQAEIVVKAPEPEAEHGGQGSKFKLPKLGINDVDITLPEVKADVKLPEKEVKSSARVEMKASESEDKSKDVGGSPLKIKMPTMKMPKFGGTTHDVTAETPDSDRVAETDKSKLKEDVTVIIKGPSLDIKTNETKATPTDTETPKTDSMGLGSPSKFKLPSFKMPKLSFSRTKPEDEYTAVETECKEDQLEMEPELKGESKSPKMTLTSFGEILKNIDVEFDVSKPNKEEENLETSKKVETDESNIKQLEPNEKETHTKQESTKSPERTGWFKFPKFGLSSPSEPAKISEKDEHKEEKSPVGETVDAEVSSTGSVQSSDAFADISSAMTSEHAGLSLPSPTKVTVKYSDPNAATEHEEMHSSIITSSTRTELISVEPNIPEKITILSPGVSSSSEDTVKLESGKIHLITSNIQATPEAQHAKLLTAFQIQSAEGLPPTSEANEAASRTTEDLQSSKRTIFERHLVRETSSERSESKETFVITKQITRIGMFDSSEPISGETASSIQRLRDSVHSEKMKFFDGAEK